MKQKKKIISNRITFKDRLKEKLKPIIRYAPRVILWGVFFAILLFGFNEVLFFIPDSWKEYDEYGDYLYNTKLLFAYILSGGLVSWAFYLYFKYKNENLNLKRAVKIFRCNDKNLLEKLGKSNPGNYDPERDISLSLILENQEQIYTFKNYGEPITQHNVIDSFNSKQPPIYGIVHKILEDVTGFSRLYQKMSKLEKLILENLSLEIQEKFEKEIYFMRVNFLELYLKAALSGKFLEIENTNEEDKPLGEFYKMILNEFYKDEKNYKQQKANYSEKKLEKLLKED